MILEQHWDEVYAGGDDDVSWHQDTPERSLAFIERVAPDRAVPIVDVGGGSSRLAGELLGRGYTDVTVLDLSRAALDLAKQRLGDRGGVVTWVAGDLRQWEPDHRYAVWHDRAVLHFLVDPGDRRAYAETLKRALVPGGHAVIGTFAPDGPEQCSGLPVMRSSPDDILELLGRGFEPVQAEREEHRSPSGRAQQFNWLIARRGQQPADS